MQTSIAVVVLPVPSTLAAFLIDPANIGNDGKKLSGKLKWPEPAVRKTVTLPPLANVFPDCEPSLAGRTNELLPLDVRDTGAANPVQFTDSAFTPPGGRVFYRVVVK